MTLIIGDIHGCYDELQALLDKCGATDDEPIYLLGDLLDKGEQPQEVFEFVRFHYNIQSIRGNHEQKHINANVLKDFPTAQDITRTILDDELYDAWLDYCRSMPLWLDIGDAYLLHGYYAPSVPIHRQDPLHLLGMLEDDPMFEWTNPDASLWYHFYDGEKPIVVGHRNYDTTNDPIVIDDKVYCIDTSCVYGGALTALRLPDWNFISVPATCNHWDKVKSKYG